MATYLATSFIPPPYPFPEAWPRVFFADQQKKQERRWLTPGAFAPVQWPATADYYQQYNYPVSSHPIPTEVPTATVGDDEEDGEFEYGYVLSDEWQERFRSSVQVQQPQRNKSKKKKKKPQQKNKSKPQRQINAEAAAAASASRSGHLQREVQAAKTRELARKWKRRGSSNTGTTDPHTAALETSLNMLFDEFCDTFQPVVWPHDPLHDKTLPTGRGINNCPQHGYMYR